MNFTIKELEALSGIKAHTIRMWERRYHFLKPSRSDTNIRRYSNDELKSLLTVALLNKYGFKISKIDSMSHEERKKAVLELSGQEAFNERLVNKMIAYMIDLRVTEFEKLLSDYIRQDGIEKTVTEIIFFFLEKVGILWHTNHILPAQEHIVSNIIRQKILSAIDNLPQVHKEEPLFLVFLPEDEYHELGLLIAYYLLRKRKIPAIYLGSSVPLTDVQFICEIKRPSYLYLHLTAFPRKTNLQKYIQILAQKFPRVKIILSGSAIQPDKKSSLSNVVKLQSLDGVISFIKSL